MKQILVYDFDKTLTYKDTLFGFFKFAAKKDILYPGKLLIYIFYMISTKLNFSSNDTLKDVGIKMFLKNLDNSELLEKFNSYHKSIKFNKIFTNLVFKDDVSYYVVSASLEEYLQPIFPNRITVFGSQIKYKNNKAIGLRYNCYKDQKVAILNNSNIKRIDVLYTDSYSDCALAEIANQIIIVNGDNQVICNSFNEFKRYFNK